MRVSCVLNNSLVSFLRVDRWRQGPVKIQDMQEWPASISRKQLQDFLGGVNFYRRFIKDFSIIVAPLTALTLTNILFYWTPEADLAFQSLKKSFTHAPVFIHPDPSSQFILEVDASDTGVGTIHYQRSDKNNRLHPCATFSRTFSPTEQRYDIRDQELLAIKTHFGGVEELKGTKLPVLVYTDHKNLS